MNRTFSSVFLILPRLNKIVSSFSSSCSYALYKHDENKYHEVNVTV